jgi:CHAT domain-containing protein/Tfp pilus assembly protein PilF
MHHTPSWLACWLAVGSARTRRAWVRRMVSFVGVVWLIGPMTLLSFRVQGTEPLSALEQAQQWAKEAHTLSQVGNFTQAEQLLLQGLALAEQAFGAQHPRIAPSLDSLANLYRTQGRWGEAELLYQRALQIRETALRPTHPTVAQSLTGLGLIYWAQGRWSEAEALHQRALHMREAALGPTHPDVAHSLNNLAILYRAQGRWSEAEAFHLRALHMREAALGPTHPDVAMSLNNLGNLYHDQGRWNEAGVLHQRALQMRETVLGSRHLDVAMSLNNLGNLHWAQGRWGEAGVLHQRALQMRETALGPAHPDVAVSLNGLGLLYRSQGRWGEAEPLYQRALHIREVVLGPTHPAVDQSLTGLGALYWVQRRWSEAEAFHQRALHIREVVLGPTHPDVAHSLNNLGNLYRSQGRWGEAEALHRRALQIREAALGLNHPDVAASLYNLGILYRAQKRWGEAEALHRRALQIREAALGAVHPDVVESLGHLAALRARSDSAQAHQLYDRARRLALAVSRVNADLDDEGQRGLAQQQQTFFKAYLSFLATQARVPQEASPASPPLGEAFVVAEQYRSNAAHNALARAGIRAAATDSAAATLARQVQDLRYQRQAARARWLAEYGQSTGERDSARLAQLHHDVRAYDDALAEATARLRAIMPAYEALIAPEPIDPATAATLLRPDEALVTFFGLDDRLLVWLVRPGHEPMYRDLAIARAALAQQVGHVRASLDQRQNPALATGHLVPFDVEGAHALYTLLLAPLRPSLEGVRHLLIVPDEVLLPLPFGALVTRADGEAFHSLAVRAQQPEALEPKELASYARLNWLVEEYQLTTLPSATALRALRQRTRAEAPLGGPLLGFGDPLLQALPRVPATRRELLAIAGALGADPRRTLYLGPQATETQVRALNASGQLGQARVLVFATHSLLAGEITGVTQPSLVLTPPATPSPQDDGLLSLEEILELKLPHTRLVVLSGCNTAAADRSGEGLSGLVRAFFFAGAPAVLATHWSVEDRATQSFMREVFRRYVSNRTLSWAEALRQGVLALMQQAGGKTAYFAHPFAWAPFFLVGEGGQDSQAGGPPAAASGDFAARQP